MSQRNIKQRLMKKAASGGTGSSTTDVADVSANVCACHLVGQGVCSGCLLHRAGAQHDIHSVSDAFVEHANSSKETYRIPPEKVKMDSDLLRDSQFILARQNLTSCE